jgi:hypothetical protein
MEPFEVPIASDAATLRHVGRPKFRFPISEKTWPTIFFNLVHRTTSHGACGVSASSGCCWKSKLLDSEDCLECADKKAGDDARGDESGEGESREEKRRSKGCNDVGLWGRSEL